MIAVNRKALQQALAALQPAVNKKIALPVLQYVHAAMDGDSLILTATRLDLWARRVVPLLPDGDGWQPVCLDFYALQDACKGKGETVHLTQTGTQVQAIIGSVNYRIATLPVEEMPPFPAPTHGLAVVVDTAKFQDTFSRIATLATTDQARPVLTAVHLHLDNPLLSFEAADGFRLARTRLPILSNTLNEGEKWSALVPAFASKAISKMTCSAVALVCDGQYLFVVGDNGEKLVISMVEGTYPDLQQVIPMRTQHSVSFLSEAMQEALMPLQKSFMPMHFAYDDNMIVLTVEEEDRKVKSTCPCRLDTGTPLTMGFNPRFMLGLLKSAGGDVLIKMETLIETTPALFTTNADPYFQGLLMPMHLGN